MHFAVQKDVLLKLLKDVSGILPVKATQTILTSILFEVFDNKVFIKATDMEMYIETNAPVIEYENGNVAIPGKKLIELISKLPSDLITFKTNSENTEVAITCKKSKFSIIALNPSQFPQKKFNSEKQGFFVPLNTFVKGINQTSFAITGSDMTSVLSGLYISIKDNVLEFAGTDASRITYKKNNLLVSVENNKIKQEDNDANVMVLEKIPSLEVILPIKACMEVLRLFAYKLLNKDLSKAGSENLDGLEEIKLTQDNEELTLQTKDVSFSTKLIAGRYPAFKSVFPAKSKYFCEVNKDELLKAVERVAVMSDETTSFISMYLNNDTMNLLARTKDLGKANEEVTIRYEGEKYDLALKTPFLVDVLKRLDCEKIMIEINSEREPLIIKPTNDEEYSYLLMPVRLVEQ